LLIDWYICLAPLLSSFHSCRFSSKSGLPYITHTKSPVNNITGSSLAGVSVKRSDAFRSMTRVCNLDFRLLLNVAILNVNVGIHIPNLVLRLKVISTQSTQPILLIPRKSACMCVSKYE
jgi:hypothetical protein